jgi:catechol 2,3-dioxygenase-like lactoylglutathione lyase family enzyme
MNAPLFAVDHTLVAVPDLDAASKFWRSLGFTLTPRAMHGGGATANHCIMFPDTYVELIAATGTGASPLASALGTRPPGGLGIAFASADAAATAAALKAAGIPTQAPVALSRPLELDGETHTVSFENVLFQADLPGLIAFACHHVTPHLTRARHEWQLHANGTTAIAELVIGAEDPAVFRPALEQLFGSAHVADAPHGLSVVLEGIALGVMNPVGLAHRFGPKAVDGLAPLPGLAATVFAVNEPDAAGAMMDMGRVPYADHHHGLVVAAKHAGGMIVAFEEN